jgi:hypothetical protein
MYKLATCSVRNSVLATGVYYNTGKLNLWDISAILLYLRGIKRLSNQNPVV